ncbi:hypothetical protein [Alloactinosynnema sp. L-07]|nr:hypothetical protein [Alloactinosynnema sp. L-07]
MGVSISIGWILTLFVVLLGVDVGASGPAEWLIPSAYDRRMYDSAASHSPAWPSPEWRNGSRDRRC